MKNQLAHNLTSAQLLGLYRQMEVMRCFEEALLAQSQAGALRGSLHLATGQEALPAGACAALQTFDLITVTYRGHGYVLAKGCDLKRVAAEILGRKDGLCRGKGGKMHLFDPTHGLLGSNGIVAGGIPSALGGALSSLLLGDGRVAMTVFGDGAVNQGVAHECFNLAGLFKLPIIFLCENNLYAEMTPLDRSSAVTKLADRMDAYDIPSVRIDGNDVLAVYEAVLAARERAASGGGPTFIEAMTYRTCGHYQLDPGVSYRTKAEVDKWKTQSPLSRYRAWLSKEGLATKEALAELSAEAQTDVDVAFEFAAKSPFADPEEALKGLFVSSPMEMPIASGGTKQSTFSEAVKSAIAQEMKRDASVVLIGEDVAHHGGMFQVTKGLLDEFGPQRVIDTPISESGFVGMGLGAALTGLKPVIELMFFDFSLVAMDQLLNQLAKTTYMSGGLSVPIVIRTQGGGYKGAAAQHSQMLETLFLHVPGIKVVAPSNAADAKALLAAAIRDPNPVLFIEHKQLYGTAGDVPSGESVGRLGEAKVVREGSDLSIFSYSYTLRLALEAAAELAKEGIEAEVVDLRTLNPLDFEMISTSVRKTHRVLVAHESHARCGVGADLAAQIQESLFDELDAPVLRVCAADVPIPLPESLENVVLPSADKIVQAARRLVRG